MSGTTVEVLAAGTAEDRSWDAFVGAEREVEFGHLRRYLDMLREVLGLRVFRLIARNEDGWTAILPLVLQRSLLGTFLTSVPYLNHAGVLGADASARSALAAEAVRLAEQLKADRLELRGRRGGDLAIPAWHGRNGYELELPRDAGALWSDLGSKVRSQIKRPRKEGYAGSVANAGGRERLYPLLARRWHELGSPILPAAFFRGLEEAVPSGVEHVVVEKDGTTAAAGLLLRAGARVEMAWAASARAHNRFGVNMLLYWSAIERAIETGASVFDFGRSAPGSGNARFKLQWGARELPLEWNVRVRSGRGRASERGDSRRGLAAACWRRMPGFFTRRLGPLLAARIPL